MRILALSDIHGRMGRLREVREALPDVPDAIVYTGDIVKGTARGDEWLVAKAEGREPDREKETIKLEAQQDRSFYGGFFDFVREWDVPTFLVPGNMDAPRRRYFETVLQSAAVSGKIYCVHGLPAIWSDFLVLGVGGEITEEGREDYFVLQVPGWEAAYLTSCSREFKNRKIFLFHTPPIGTLDLDKGRHKGNRIVNEMIEEHDPWLTFCGHAHNSRGQEQIGQSVVVNPGSLKAGFFALVDSETREAEFRSLGQ